MTAVEERGEGGPVIVRKGGWDVTLAQWIHLVGAALAAGSMFFIIFALLPSMGVLDADQGGRLMETLFPRARLIFWTAIIFLSLGGLYLTIIGSQIRSFEQLFSTTYGRILTIKIALAVVVSKLALALTLPVSEHLSSRAKYQRSSSWKVKGGWGTWVVSAACGRASLESVQLHQFGQIRQPHEVEDGRARGKGGKRGVGAPATPPEGP